MNPESLMLLQAIDEGMDQVFEELLSQLVLAGEELVAAVFRGVSGALARSFKRGLKYWVSPGLRCCVGIALENNC